jgi:hypothetical protein
VKLLVYVRPWAADYFEFLARAAFPDAEITLVSDFRGVGAFDVAERLTRYVDCRPARIAWPSWVSTADEYDIISRNFFLRTLPFDRARLMASAMARVIDEVVDESGADGVLAMSGDNYVLDVLGRAGYARGIPVCGLIPCPARGYARVTMRGEYAAFRKVGDEEAESATRQLAAPDFKPLDMTDWLSMYGSYVTLTRAVREKPKRFWFPFKARLAGDPYNYHYLGSTVSRVSLLSQGLFIDRHFEKQWRQRAAGHSGLKVYLPLPAYPEATTDYHVAQLDLIDFHTMLFEILDAFSAEGDCLVVVKEHPGMMGARPPGFYKDLRRYPGVILVSGQVRSLDLMAATDAILTWTGTGGLEAAVRQRPVVTIGRPYFSSGPGFREIQARSEVPHLPGIARAAARIALSDGEPIEVVRDVLATCFPGEFRQLGFAARGEAGRDEARVLGKGIREQWDAWAAAFPAAFATHLAGTPTAPGPAARA